MNRGFGSENQTPASTYQQQARELVDTWRDEWHLEPEPDMDGANSRIYESLVNHVATTLQSQLEQLRAENERLNAIVSAYENQDEQALEEAEKL